MLISKVEDAMHMDRSQQTVMRMIAEMERAAKVREHAALLIQKVWRAYHPAGQYERQSQAKRFKAMEQVGHANLLLVPFLRATFSVDQFVSASPPDFADCVRAGVPRTLPHTQISFGV